MIRRPLSAVVLSLTLTALMACTSTSPRTPERAVAAPAASAAEPVRAMSFNIRYGTAADGDNAWPLRRHLTLAVIRDYGPTVLGVQEALRFQLDEIARELPHLGEVGVGRSDGIEAGEYAAILYDRRRLGLLDHGTFWLSDTPDVPGSTSWGNRITRIATWARFHDRRTRATFFVFNTHWDHESQPSRERSAALVLERIRARTPASDPVLLMGDFNAGEDNDAYRALLSTEGGRPDATRLHDTFRIAHPDAVGTGTFHAFTGDVTGDRIDAILASPEWRTLEATIIRMHENGRYPSDHFPVTATLVLTQSRRDAGAAEYGCCEAQQP